MLQRHCVAPAWHRLNAALARILLLAALAVGATGCDIFRGDKLTEVKEFGGNPGKLKMFKYLPPGLPASRPLVVALHGCTQHADDYDDEPGWINFADRFRFALLLPQEQVNSGKCFRWFEPAQTQRDSGEALSIAQMIAKMKADHRIDSRHIYVTGLSAGGAMTAVMLAAYPELFAGAAIMAGVPYGCARSDIEATRKCGVLGRLAPDKDLTAAQWGDLVRRAADYQGARARVSIWQGANDVAVDPRNQQELMKQWTDVLGIDQTPDRNETVHGHAHRVYQDSSGNALVETWLISGMGHATAIDPGNADDQCGKPARFIASAGICSTYYVVKFWGLDRLP